MPRTSAGGPPRSTHTTGVPTAIASATTPSGLLAHAREQQRVRLGQVLEQLIAWDFAPERDAILYPQPCGQGAAAGLLGTFAKDVQMPLVHVGERRDRECRPFPCKELPGEDRPERGIGLCDAGT